MVLLPNKFISDWGCMVRFTGCNMERESYPVNARRYHAPWVKVVVTTMKLCR